eukprot:9488688-Pyramimonas_sp.AAC.1
MELYLARLSRHSSNSRIIRESNSGTWKQRHHCERRNVFPCRGGLRELVPHSSEQPAQENSFRRQF